MIININKIDDYVQSNIVGFIELSYNDDTNTDLCEESDAEGNALSTTSGKCMMVAI